MSTRAKKNLGKSMVFCNDMTDSQIAQNHERYIFYCSVKNAMVDGRDCQRCKLNKFLKV